MRQHEPLAPYTTFRIGGEALWFASITQEEEILPALLFAQEKQIPVTILGGGSNVLVSDAGVSGLVIRMQQRGIEVEDAGKDVLLTAKAGEPWDPLVEYVVERGWWGIENLSSIPGSVGASVIQNIGAYGVEIGNCVEQVCVLNSVTMKREIFSKTECAFSYRNSLLKERKDLVVLSVTYRLKKHSDPNISYADLKNWFCERAHMTPSVREVNQAVKTIRNSKFPDLGHYGTAGSYFKNPIVPAERAAQVLQQFPDAKTWNLESGDVKFSAAWLIDHVANMKGTRMDDVGVWDKQALVLVNYGKATAENVIRYADTIKQKIFTATGIKLEEEVVFLR